MVKLKKEILAYLSANKVAAKTLSEACYDLHQSKKIETCYLRETIYKLIESGEIEMASGQKLKLTGQLINWNLLKDKGESALPPEYQPVLIKLREILLGDEYFVARLEKNSRDEYFFMPAMTIKVIKLNLVEAWANIPE